MRRQRRSRNVVRTRGLVDPLTLAPYAHWRGDSTDTATNFDWTDRTGHGHTLRQATAANKPTIVTPSEILSQPALRFDGSNDFLEAIDAASNYTLLHNGAGVSVYMLLIPRALTVNARILATVTAGTGWFFGQGTVSGFLRCDALDNAGAFVFTGAATQIAGAFAVGTPVLLSYFYRESASPEFDVRTNNVTGASGTTAIAPGSNAPATTLNLGRRPDGGNFSQIDVAEILILDRVASAAENIATTDYFRHRYGVG